MNSKIAIAFVPWVFMRMTKVFARRKVNVKVSDPIIIRSSTFQIVIMLILQMRLSAICPDGLTYIAAGGTFCQCSASGTLECPTLTSPGCYCPADSYLNAQGVCAPNAECQCKWLVGFSFCYESIRGTVGLGCAAMMAAVQKKKRT